MKITNIQLKQFRCFSSLSLSFSSPLVLIQGPNGSGKTSLLEALYYAGHLHSFKTSSPKELIYHDTDSFFVKVSGESTPAHPEPVEGWNIQAGYSNQKRIIKINDTIAKTYRDLYAAYRTISVAEADMALVQGAPEVRRSFLDDAISFISADYRLLLRKYRKVLEQRNALFMQSFVSDESYTLWTEQLMSLTVAIQQERTRFLADLEGLVNDFLRIYCNFEGKAVTFIYTIKRSVFDFDLKSLEIRAKKSLIGAHLDDFAISFIGKQAKNFASRGQQKLLTIIMKIAVGSKINNSYILLLDDFVTDFDESRTKCLLRLLVDTNAQLILTIPSSKSILHDAIKEYPHQIISLE